jgi:hypothetical protein
VSWWSALDVLEVAAGVVAGGFINWWFSRRASKELRSEAAALRRATEQAQEYTDALISYLERHEIIGKVPRDAQGRPIKSPIVRLNHLRATARLEDVTEEQGEPPTDSEHERED